MGSKNSLKLKGFFQLLYSAAQQQTSLPYRLLFGVPTNTSAQPALTDLKLK